MILKVLIFLAFFALAITQESKVKVFCSFEKISSSYSCNPYKIEGVLSEINSEIEVNGTHLSNFNDDDVTYLRFNSPLTLAVVPTKIFEFFPSLTTFGLHGVNLTTILSDSFSNCYKLKSLHIDGNENLEELPEGFAKGCANLANIYLPGNGLKIIDSDAFRGLENLNYLVLTKNQLQNLSATTFITTPNLEFLFLDYNRLENFNQDLFYPLRKLQLLSVTNNFIAQITLEIFRNNFLLDHIFLDNNHLTSIEPEFFDEFPGSKREFYEYRFLKNNCTNSAVIASKNSDQDKSYDEENFKNCFERWRELQQVATTEIEELSSSSLTMDIEESTAISFQHNCRYFLNENRKYTCVLEDVDLVLTSIEGEHYADFNDENVTQIFFYNSILTKVPSEVFKKFPNLEFLSVANTQLTIINDQTFGDDCGKVKKIDASENLIYKIVETSFKKCTELEVIDVSGNPIESIDGEIFHYDPHLKNIILHKNK